METPKINGSISGSFRDPSGFLFYQDGLVYRQVNIAYKENYDHLMSSGLYKALIDAGLLIPHEEVEIDGPRPDRIYKIIKPELVPFISYPYEWCFSQLKDAALVTLKIQKKALEFKMSLKDSSAFNIQFRKGRPIFIDTLSFEKYCQGRPWVAYRQFCKQFLAPLALMCYRDIRLNKLLRIYIDGIPLDLASSLLPILARFRLPLFLHIYLHAKTKKHFADKPVKRANNKMSLVSFIGLIDHLESAVRGMNWQARGTEWADYYEDVNYASDSFEHKKQIVSGFLDKAGPKTIWDLGANVGVFSRIAGNKGIQAVSFDIDPAAVEKNYLECIKNNETNILPLLLDLTNPSPAIGWEHKERMSILERACPDAALALALVHHLAIFHNVPLEKIAAFFNKICNILIVEFVPKSDSQVQRMLLNRADIFPDYTQQVFENEFRKYFIIRDSVKIRGCERMLYLMDRISRQ